MSLVGKPAPDFSATAIMGDNSVKSDFNFKEYTKGKIVVLFFYPLDFTFVCPTEILSFNDYLPQFADKGAVVVGVSVDSQFSHLAYKNTPVDKGGIGKINFPLVSDLTKRIARDYDVLFNDAIAFRGTFIINEEGKVIHETINDFPLGRNVEETLRLIDAWSQHQKHGEVCPANWNKGSQAMKPTQEGVTQYLSKRSA